MKTMRQKLNVLPEALLEVTEDPIDAMRLAADLYAMSAYRAERARAPGAGTSRPPKPVSKYMRLFTSGLKARLNEIARLFDDDELDRLKRIGPAIATRIERNDSDLGDQILALVCMSPENAVAWIRDHLDEMEARFAS